MRFAVLAAAAGLLALAGCTPTPKSVDTYFPLGTGHAWTYRVSNAGRPDSILRFEIKGEETGDRGERRFLLDESGSRYYLRHGDVMGYSVSPGIWTIFLDGPLKRGHRFDGARADFSGFRVVGEVTPTPAPDATPPAMRTVESSGYKLVTATGRKITVPAGIFDDCLEVTHIAGPTTGVKYFAPRIGMVFAEAWSVHPVTQERSLITRQELVHYRVGGRSGGTPPSAPIDAAASRTSTTAGAASAATPTDTP